MSFEQTEKNRTLGQSKNINLGEFISPKGSTGQATPDYVGDSLWNDFGDAMGRLGRGIKDYGDVVGKQRKEEEQKQQTAYESDMYDKIRNIQRMPESVMTSSQKEIEVDKVVKEYSKIVPFEKRVQILNANNANVNETYTYLASKAGKEQAVSQQVKQNEDLAKVALEYDPSMLDKPFATQVERGREIADTQNLMHSYLSQAIVIGNSKDPQSVSARENCFDQMAVYADQLLPLEMKKAYWEGRLTENDIVSFRNSLALSLSTSENPFTGTQLGKEQAEYFSKNISDRLFKNMTDARADAMKHTSEYQKNYIDVVTNTYLLKTDPAALVMLGKSPEAFANYFSMNREQLTEELRNIGTTSDGNHLVFPGDTSNEIITALANNKKMPQQCSDARLELEARQGRQQPSPSTNKNFLEQIQSYGPGYYNTLEPSDKKRHIEGLKQSIPTRLSFDIKSLVQAKIKPQEGEGWFGTVVRNINNVVVGEGVSYDEGSLLTQGNKSELINSAVNEYADTLRNAGVDESDIKDIVVEAYRLSGVPVKETDVAPGNYTQLAIKALSAIYPANIVTEFGQAMTNIATGVATSMAQGEQQDGVSDANTTASYDNNAARELFLRENSSSAEGTPLMMTTEQDVANSKEYKDAIKTLQGRVSREQMTGEQAENEYNQLWNKIRGVLSEFAGVKTAEAAELPVELSTRDKRPLESTSGLTVESLGKSVKNNNIFNTRGKNKTKGFAKFKTAEDAIKEAELDANIKVERFKGDVMKLCEQYAPRSDNNLTSRYCAGLLYRTPGVSDADKQTLQAVVDDIMKHKNKQDQLKADKDNESIIRHIANKYTNLFYRGGKVVNVRPILIWQAQMETGTKLV